MARRILRDVPAYAEVVSSAELRASVVTFMEPVLRGIVEGRGPREDEIRRGDALGRRRADQTLPADVLIRGIRLAYATLWLELDDAVRPDETRARSALSRAAPTYWRWVDALTDAVATAHADRVRSREGSLAALRQRFVELVAIAEPSDPEMLAVTSDLGFEVSGTFRGIAVELIAMDGHQSATLQAALGDIAGVFAVGLRGSRLVIAAQSDALDQFETAIRTTLPQAAAGIGLQREGPAGLAASFTDAELALGIAGASTTVRFDDQWLWATLTRAAPRLRPQMQPVRDIADANEHLRETVEVFSESGFSITETARRLDIHPNTAAYRLERWRVLTGYDPREFSGLASSLASIRLGADVTELVRRASPSAESPRHGMSRQRTTRLGWPSTSSTSRPRRAWSPGAETHCRMPSSADARQTMRSSLDSPSSRRWRMESRLAVRSIMSASARERSADREPAGPPRLVSSQGQRRAALASWRPADLSLSTRSRKGPRCGARIPLQSTVGCRSWTPRRTHWRRPRSRGTRRGRRRR